MASEDSWDKVKDSADALRTYWNGTRAIRPQPGDSKLGALVGAHLEAVAAYADGLRARIVGQREACAHVVETLHERVATSESERELLQIAARAIRTMTD